MPLSARLRSIPNLIVLENVPLAVYTRFGLGGPADLLVETSDEAAFGEAWRQIHDARVPVEVIGGGSNLIVSDEGFRGVILRFVGDTIHVADNVITAGAGATLQALVDASIDAGLGGIHTMTRIPGLVGAAVYGNAGAYGHSIHEWVTEVRFHDGSGVRSFANADCEFRYRESVFKRHKNWTILSTRLALQPADALDLRRKATEIQTIRDEKYPPTMKCAGSIFKNLLFDQLPPAVQAHVPPSKVREGKVPSAHFLEAVGAKGFAIGGIRNADYHANLIYNTGTGTAAEVCEMVDELKRRVLERFGFELQEEVQYIGFGDSRRSY